MKRLTFIFIVLALALAACQPQFSVENAASGSVLFQDDFSKTNSGWDDTQDSLGNITSYYENGYRIFNNQPHQHIWANPGLNFTDALIQVKAGKIAGPDNNYFGVICRYRDAKNFYILGISSDGFYGILKVKDGNVDILGAEAMEPSKAILLGGETNDLRADCVGSQLTLYANGTQLKSVKDTDFTSGDVGLEVSTLQTAGADIYFDNFSIIKP